MQAHLLHPACHLLLPLLALLRPAQSLRPASLVAAARASSTLVTSGPEPCNRMTGRERLAV